MPFSSTGSVVSTDLDNMLRGLNRDNSDTSHTGDTSETTLKSYSVPANTIGATGGIHLVAAGYCTGAGGTKTINFSWGSTTILNGTVSSGSNSWIYEVWIWNTATNAQRGIVKFSTFASASGSPTQTFYRFMDSQDTTANTTIKITGTLGNSGDTVVANQWDLFVVQIN